MALFLALAAIQFVVAQNMPASSYITALGQLILASYLVLFFAGIESLVAYKLAYFCDRAKRCPAGPLSHALSSDLTDAYTAHLECVFHTVLPAIAGPGKRRRRCSGGALTSGSKPQK